LTQIEKIKKVKKLIKDISEIASFMWKRGWAERNAGNISVNITDFIAEDIRAGFGDNDNISLGKSYPALSNMIFIISVKGTRMRDMAKKPLRNTIIIMLNDKGNGYRILFSKKSDRKTLLPTSEMPTHLSIHEKLEESGSVNKVVLHAHVTELIALTQIEEFANEKSVNKILFGMHPEAIMFIPKGVGFVDYTISGNDDIAQKTVEIINDYDIVLWEKHGVFAIGKDVNETFDAIDIIAKSAKIYFICKSAGFKPQGLSDEDIKKLKEVYR
jgi:rhamnulose-1-phosphate aldolase